MAMLPSGLYLVFSLLLAHFGTICNHHFWLSCGVMIHFYVKFGVKSDTFLITKSGKYYNSLRALCFVVCFGLVGVKFRYKNMVFA